MHTRLRSGKERGFPGLGAPKSSRQDEADAMVRRSGQALELLGERAQRLPRDRRATGRGSARARFGRRAQARSRRSERGTSPRPSVAARRARQLRVPPGQQTPGSAIGARGRPGVALAVSASARCLQRVGQLRLRRYLESPSRKPRLAGPLWGPGSSDEANSISLRPTRCLPVGHPPFPVPRPTGPA